MTRARTPKSNKQMINVFWNVTFIVGWKCVRRNFKHYIPNCTSTYTHTLARTLTAHAHNGYLNRSSRRMQTTRGQPIFSVRIELKSSDGDSHASLKSTIRFPSKTNIKRFNIISFSPSISGVEFFVRARFHISCSVQSLISIVQVISQHFLFFRFWFSVRAATNQTLPTAKWKRVSIELYVAVLRAHEPTFHETYPHSDGNNFKSINGFVD